MTERLMYDGINALAAGIARSFPDAVMVAGYVNGTYAWTQAEWDLFPRAQHVGISVTASASEGVVLDVENGDATPGQAEAWIRERKAAGVYRPTVYCSLATVPAVRAGTGAYVLGKDYDIWVADYDGSAAAPPVPGTPPASFAAKQYENTAAYDVSAVYDDGWPHLTPPVPALAAPAGFDVSATAMVRFSWHAVPGAVKYWVKALPVAPHITEPAAGTVTEPATGTTADLILTRGRTYQVDVWAETASGAGGHAIMKITV